MTTLQYRRGKEVKVQKNRGERTVLMWRCGKEGERKAEGEEERRKSWR
jgi:hypothetical protein